MLAPKASSALVSCCRHSTPVAVTSTSHPLTCRRSSSSYHCNEKPPLPYTSGHQQICVRANSSGPLTATADTPDAALGIKSFEEIPGPKSLPYIGTLYKYLPFGEYSFTRPHESDMKRYEKYGALVREEIFPGINQIRLFDPEDIATLFRHEGKHPNRMPLEGFKAYRESRGVSVGLANLQGEEWQRFRSQVQKKMMRRTSACIYIPAQEPIADELVDRMRALRDDELEVPDYLNELYKWAMESIGVVCFDSRLGTMDYGLTEDSEPEKFIRAVNRAFGGLHKTTFLWEFYKTRPNSTTIKNLYNDLDTIWDISKKHIDKTLEKANNNEEMLVPPEESLLLTLLARPNLSQDEALSLVSDLFMAGVDTTAHTMAFNLYQLAMNPEVQRRLQAEIDELAPRGTPLTNNTIENMKYLKAVTKETSRINPTTSGTMRIMDKDMVFQGYKVPAGVPIFCGTTVICMQPKYYDDPERFMPERWLRNESGQKERNHGFSLLPFGHGPRMCIGRRFAEQEIWLGLIKIFQNFNVEYHYHPIRPTTRLISMPDKPLRFTFTDRK